MSYNPTEPQRPYYRPPETQHGVVLPIAEDISSDSDLYQRVKQLVDTASSDEICKFLMLQQQTIVSLRSQLYKQIDVTHQQDDKINKLEYHLTHLPSSSTCSPSRQQITGRYNR